MQPNRGDNQGIERVAAGLSPWDAATLQRLRQRRWRQGKGGDRRRLWLGVLLTLLLHGLFFALVYHEMKLRPWNEPAPPHEQVLQVRLLAATAPPATAPPPLENPLHATVEGNQPMPPRKPKTPPPSRSRTPALQVIEHAPVPGAARPAEPAPAATPAPASSTASAPGLYGKQGQILLPAGAASSAAKPEPGYVQRQPQGDTQIMHNQDPVKYKATRFEQYFPPPGENALQSGLRKVMTPLTTKHDVDVHGMHLKCSFLGGCQDPPAPPSRKDGDERLSMAPAKPLGGPDPHAAPPPSLEQCIAIYRKGDPLPYGCPVDTPDRSAEADMKAQAAKHLQLKQPDLP